MRVYVKNLRNQSLMPTSPRKARILLKQGKAKVLKRTPFIIKILIPTGETIQVITAGMDTGSKMIGCSAISNGQVIYQSELQIRQDISKKMEQRKMYRRNRRGRKTRYRKVRWQNSASMMKKGRLAPSIKSKIDSHLREKKFIESILPVTHWKVETASFDIHKITNPDVKRWEYQGGNQKGFYNIKAYILSRDGYKCQKCKIQKGKLHVHHIIFRSDGGTNSPDNLITLCKSCHSKLHTGEFSIKKSKSKTKHATEIGIIKSQLKKQFGDFEETFGYETKFKREHVLNLPKTHYYDAVAICCEEGELVEKYNHMIYKKYVSKGDYQQTKGSRSEKKIPTGKLFGFRKFDLVKTSKGVGFIKGKRSSGYFSLMDIFNNKITDSVNVKKNYQRLIARTTTLIQEVAIPPLP